MSIGSPWMIESSPFINQKMRSMAVKGGGGGALIPRHDPSNRLAWGGGGG
jgi:hypothetical protein